MSYNAVSLSNGDGSVKQFGGAGGGGGSTSASNVSYDNTTSQLEATNVQTALDEIASQEGAVATLVITTASTELFGQSITVAGQYATYTATFSALGQAEVDILFLGEYTVTCLEASATIFIDTIGADYEVSLVLSHSALSITANSTEMYSKTLSVSFGGSEIGTVALDASGQGSFNISETGTYTLSYNGSMSQTVEVAELADEIPVTYYGVTTLATFAAATEQQVADMVKAADAGCIDLYEDAGWRVGQERTVSLSAIASSGTYDGVSWDVVESHDAQNVTLVLMHQGRYTLVDPVLNKDGTQRTKCSFVCGMKDCLATGGSIYESGSSYVWSDTSRRNWCNSGFRQALPQVLRTCFKQFNTYSTDSSGFSTILQDYFTFPGEKEVLGTRTYSVTQEANYLSTLTWYSTSSNRVKLGPYPYYWWTRSIRYNTTEQYCMIMADGTGNTTYATSSIGISPFGCL